MYQYFFSSAGRGNGRGAMPFLRSFALEHEIATFAWIDNASVQFPLSIYATKGVNLLQHVDLRGFLLRQRHRDQLKHELHRRELQRSGFDFHRSGACPEFSGARWERTACATRATNTSVHFQASGASRWRIQFDKHPS